MKVKNETGGPLYRLFFRYPTIFGPVIIFEYFPFLVKPFHCEFLCAYLSPS